MFRRKISVILSFMLALSSFCATPVLANEIAIIDGTDEDNFESLDSSYNDDAYIPISGGESVVVNFKADDVPLVTGSVSGSVIPDKDVISGDVIDVVDVTAISAFKDKKNAIKDTVILDVTPKGKKNTYSISAGNISNNSVLTVMKGSSFTIKGADAKSYTTANKKAVSVSSKGVVKAKKAESAPVSVGFAVNGVKKVINVIVIDNIVTVSCDSISGNKPSVKKLTVTAYEGQNVDIKVDTILQATFMAAKNKGVISADKVVLKDDGYHLVTKAVKKGSASIPFTAMGKKFTLKVKVKAVKK